MARRTNRPLDSYFLERANEKRAQQIKDSRQQKAITLAFNFVVACFVVFYAIAFVS